VNNQVIVTMNYNVRLYVPEDTSPAQRQAAERLFRQALEAALGDAALVAPVYAAWQAIVAEHGETPDVQALSVDQRMVQESWQQAERAALEAVFGPHRHLDEGGYEIRLG
jgi:hypothetical protein